MFLQLFVFVFSFGQIRFDTDHLYFTSFLSHLSRLRVVLPPLPGALLLRLCCNLQCFCDFAFLRFVSVRFCCNLQCFCNFAFLRFYLVRLCLTRINCVLQAFWTICLVFGWCLRHGLELFYFVRAVIYNVFLTLRFPVLFLWDSVWHGSPVFYKLFEQFLLSSAAASAVLPSSFVSFVL